MHQQLFGAVASLHYRHTGRRRNCFARRHPRIEFILRAPLSQRLQRDGNEPFRRHAARVDAIHGDGISRLVRLFSAPVRRANRRTHTGACRHR